MKMKKRAAGLLLAAVLLASAAVPGARAAEFTDSDQIDPAYEAAISYCVEEEYLSPYFTGDFNPRGQLNRGAVAKLLASMALTPSMARMLTVTGAPAADVPADSTYAGYIAFCVSQGIMLCYSDGTFRANGSVPTVGFAKAMLQYMNYAQDDQRYMGDGWDVRTWADAEACGLLPPRATAPQQPLTREDAAWMIHFAMTWKGTPVPAVPDVPQPPALPFTDADRIDPEYAPGVAFCTERGILSGYGNGQFSPHSQLTRGAAAKILSNMRETAARPGVETPYRDVPVGHTFSGYIRYCAQEKLISGYADGTFRPANPLSSVAFAKMLLNHMHYTQDAARYQGSGWKDRVWEDARACGMVTDSTRFTPESFVSRDQAAWMVYYAMTWTR